MLRALGKPERKKLNELGLRIGAECFYVPALLKPEAQDLKTLLWWLWEGGAQPDPRPEKAASFVTRQPAGLCQAQGYRLFPGRRNGLAVRADSLERLVSSLYRDRPSGAFSPLPAMAQPLDGDEAALKRLLPELGFRRHGGGDKEAPSFAPQGRRSGPRPAQAKKPKARRDAKSSGAKKPRKSERKEKQRQAPNPDSPFAKLAELYGR